MKKNNVYYLIALILTAIYFTLDILLDKIPMLIEITLLGIIFVLFILMVIDDIKKRKGK